MESIKDPRSRGDSCVACPHSKRFYLWPSRLSFFIFRSQINPFISEVSHCGGATDNEGMWEGLTTLRAEKTCTD